MPQIKILIGCHKPSWVPRGELFVPVHAGRAIASAESKDGRVSQKDLDWLLAHTIGDDSGDNISHRNREYCECTVLYWAWKHYEELGNPDFIGFFQYRRNFAVNRDAVADWTQVESERQWANYSVYYPRPDYCETFGLTEARLAEVLKSHAGIIPEDCDASLRGLTSLRDEYDRDIAGCYVCDLDIMLEKTRKLYPEIGEFATQRLAQTKKTCSQIWILPRETFFAYMEFLFTVLSACDEVIDTSSYDVMGRRTMGYLAECLCDIYMNWLETRGSRFYRAPIIKLENTEPESRVDRGKLARHVEKKLKEYRLKSLLSFGPRKQHYRDKESLYQRFCQYCGF